MCSSNIAKLARAVAGRGQRKTGALRSWGRSWPGITREGGRKGEREEVYRKGKKERLDFGLQKKRRAIARTSRNKIKTGTLAETCASVSLTHLVLSSPLYLYTHTHTWRGGGTEQHLQRRNIRVYICKHILHFQTGPLITHVFAHMPSC